MAIDTAAKRANVNRINILFPFLGLAPSAGVSTADRVNAGRGYIGLAYEEPPEEGSRARFKIGVGVGIGFLFAVSVVRWPWP